ncbi:Alpha-amylase precursor [Pseudobythopirellula maris]|uniref:Alpha-amylase n=1 Tax=Pseudobythopirellula maris TaxID=2527991 RepID=A0A5C5ZH38_9BACT|nr:alpha-amylase family glycosyl hydrolase [Pseudobythopirellula maris]TWT86652.1 Alpha-amylase precursor [Pseudobythopirellula maris]
MTRTDRQHAPSLCTRLTAAVLVVLASCASARGEDVSQPAILQMFEARWDVIEDRMADIFVAGYGRMWLPPPAKADSGDHSVGYDVFDRFDLGSPRDETLYGTETGLKTLIDQAHSAGVRVNTDYIANHNGFSDDRTFDSQGTADPSDDVYWNESGGYPGFVMELPGDPDGDYHPLGPTDQEFERLAGLIDIAQEKNHQFIRHPVVAGDPQNIPAGTEGIFGRGPVNAPDAANARFYPDQGLGGNTVYDPKIGSSVTLYDFNTSDPMAGDAYAENATGLLIRNLRWMVQEIGVDGFRYDAARHFPRWVLDYLDQGAFLAKQEPLLDGSPDHVYSFIETGGDSDAFVNGFIRKDIDNNDLGTIGGNRDALDFNLFFTLRDNLQENGLANDWRNIKNRSIDIVDDGLANNGTQGVAFVQSHDDGPSHLNPVAHAWMLMRPGQALVYLNAKQFGENRDFPQDGKGDALGGLYGDKVTRLVNLRNTHGRGNYIDRTPSGDEKETLVYERENSALVVLSNRGDSGYDDRTVQTSFAPGTRLVELSGNVNDPLVNQLGEFAEVLTVGPTGAVDLRVPRNRGADGTEHRSGYFVYGVAPPEATMRLTDASGADLMGVLAGSTPAAGQGGVGGPSDDFFNGVTRLADITVVTGDSFNLRVETSPVTLPDGYRDHHADGDRALFSVDAGTDANGSGAVDHVTPGSVAYGFEEFTGTNQPGFEWDGSQNVGLGSGVFEQTIDTTQLAEGRHYLTGRVFRHRDAATGGDGGPDVFSDARRVIYVDRLKPESTVVSFEPFSSDPGNPNNRDLIVESLDKTAESVHVFFDYPIGETEAELLARVAGGEGAAGYYDRDQWVAGRTGVTNGNHTATVVTIEPTGTYNIQRFAGLGAATNLGAGIGDANADGVFGVNDLVGLGALEPVLNSQNNIFRATLDATADGLIDNRDLFAIGPLLVDGGATPAVLAEYDAVLRRRGDLNDDGDTDAADLVLLGANYGPGEWLFDLNVDGVTDAHDAKTLITQLLRTSPGDYNLDGAVDAADFTVWRDSLNDTGPALAADGDFDGDVDQDDYGVWVAAYGFTREPVGGVAVSVPEPGSCLALPPCACWLLGRLRARREN